MPRSARVAVGIGSILVAALSAAACGSSEHPSSISAGAGETKPATGSVGGNGSLDFGGNGNGTGVGNGTGSGGTGTGATLPDACAANLVTAQAVPLDMYIMLDVSSSMLDATATTTSKWDAVKTALESFLKDKDSAGLGVGIQYFPIELPDVPTSCTNDGACGDAGPCFTKFCYGFYSVGGYVPCQQASDCVNPNNQKDYGPCTPLAACSMGDYVCSKPGAECLADNGEDYGLCTQQAGVCLNPDSCDAAEYATPAAAIAVLPGASADLVASIDAQTPLGNTPTAPALTGAIQQASSWAKAHPDHRVITVLATDGIPTRCEPTDIDPVAAIAKAGAAATPSISTFVIGVFGPSDVAQGAPDNLNLIAQQGGTQAAFIVDTQQDVTTQFLKALDTIRGARLACDFQIPQPTSGTDVLDYGRVNVQFTDSGQASLVYYVKNAASCDATSGGWYYDVEPSSGATPTKIIACPSSCTAFQGAADGASVGIALGCTTVVK
ncbi:MAG: VWA domain-containing protein [Polyangiaceae bacterium]